MIKERIYIYRRLNIILDAFIAGISFIAAMYLRIYYDTGTLVLTEHYQRYFWLFYVVTILWPILLNINGIYPTTRLRTLGRAIWIIIKSSFQGLFIILAALFIFKLQIVSRVILVSFCIIATSLLILKESVVIYSLHLLRKSGADLRNVLIVGTIESVKDIISTIEKNAYLGLSIIGLLVPREEVQKKEAYGKKILGGLNEIKKILHSIPIDNAIITIDRKDFKDIDDIIFHCEEEGVEIWIIGSLFNIKIAKLDTDTLCDIPFFIFRTTPKFSWQILVKNIFDKIIGLVLGILSLPIILIAAILIKLTSKGPVFFKQTRCTVQGRKFTLYKLRTMYAGAEKMKEELEDENIMEGPIFKLDKDPRITPVGRILRKTSMDELPQLWNVLKGDMSLIGPRPPVPKEVKEYKGWQRRRLSMKPGISGLWQVSGRSGIKGFDKLTELDLKYIDAWSLWLDVKIFFKTIWVVLTMKGAK